MEIYKGSVVKESLGDITCLDRLKILNIEETSDSNVDDRWHIYTVEVDESEIKEISQNLKSEKWYAHFWKNRDVIAVFKNKIFRFNYDNKESWKPAIEYGLSVGIPKEQLDFLID